MGSVLHACVSPTGLLARTTAAPAVLQGCFDMLSMPGQDAVICGRCVRSWLHCCCALPAAAAGPGVLPPAVELYLSVSAAGCLQADAKDAEALAILQDCVDILAQLHEAGADAAVWHAAVGVAKLHSQDMQVPIYGGQPVRPGRGVGGARAAVPLLDSIKH